MAREEGSIESSLENTAGQSWERGGGREEEEVEEEAAAALRGGAATLCSIREHVGKVVKKSDTLVDLRSCES